ncbi:hypothetical protein ACO0RG_001661 [Hanseniaspora osmophila]|uniref:Uncharacterized protein n=1 Tax=Hanseniaspora osmophila TaxID=56408 RepID=A0A1E5RHZ1_9ASCO|nr:hypothetical protein AWRI3579_g1628 [Hanseniaspora osmophila]
MKFTKNIIAPLLLASRTLADSLVVPIDYDYTIDLYYYFKDGGVQIEPVAEGLKIDLSSNITDVCGTLASGMVVINVDNAPGNTLVTWNQYDVFHLLNEQHQDLTWDSVLVEACGGDTSLETTTLASNTPVSTSGTGSVSTLSATSPRYANSSVSGIEGASLPTVTDIRSYVASLTSAYAVTTPASVAYATGTGKIETFVATVVSSESSSYTTYKQVNSSIATPVLNVVSSSFLNSNSALFSTATPTNALSSTLHADPFDQDASNATTTSVSIAILAPAIQVTTTYSKQATVWETITTCVGHSECTAPSVITTYKIVSASSSAVFSGSLSATGSSTKTTILVSTTLGDENGPSTKIVETTADSANADSSVSASYKPASTTVTTGNASTMHSSKFSTVFASSTASSNGDSSYFSSFGTAAGQSTVGVSVHAQGKAPTNIHNPTQTTFLAFALAFVSFLFL